ncbi:hypothetical protein HM1_2654 [Heliomicrobium modesticaldum Ice1]|uniref:Uncharacterized protein n=1 Tax=Heliobacterium modesticaldum (strain ATCC 51547 / Ice1) TaxID=498761 RepID=B0TBH0_HELMI|nr:hypothetical protein HM1_2654 [Heliomicrobium modesticaldum Ice1]
MIVKEKGAQDKGVLDRRRYKGRDGFPKLKKKGVVSTLSGEQVP